MGGNGCPGWKDRALGEEEKEEEKVSELFLEEEEKEGRKGVKEEKVSELFLAGERFSNSQFPEK
ncbi:MAG: hypothetical protein KKE86_13055 [Planctomycetes bacterium]|nr:hypothetical protein [Planctomycetota bacterium]MBU4400251.1 hypothetical protein [Planctomycetota bacterium]MCG2684258.1 hypothetical protein [Planctomycetales bacterium]